MLYYLHRVHQLGLKKSINRVGSFFENRWWQLHWSCRLALDPKLECPKKLFQQIKTTHVTFFLQHPLIKKELLFQNQINQIKDDFITLCDNKKAFVFNQLVSLDDPDIWQKDPISKRFINLKKITVHKETDAKESSGEIRIAWELARMHHLVRAALKTKEVTDPQEKKIITDFIFEQILHWQAQNPFMSGIHWYNAMEVAIRATNLIFIAQLLETKLKEEKLWQTLIDILYQHKLFIHSHWETSATPNNHYLADLIGYAHLLLFFNHSTKEVLKHLNQTIIAFKVQISSDGWAYEGSTGYHRLDTELLLHLTLLMQWTNHPHKKEADALFSTAYKQLILLQGPNTDLPTIGDNDDGKLLTGISIFPSTKTDLIHHSPDAGLSIITQKNFHFIMRHAEFNQKSPTGHYHRDDLSFILSLEGIPIFIDPGSGMYTGNKKLRNQMRSWDAHNTVFCQDELLSDRIENLFQLTKKEWSQQPVIINEANQIKIVSKRPLYCTSGFIMRSIVYTEKKIQISDQVVSEYQHELKQTLICGPSIELIQENKEGTIWSLLHKNKKIGILSGEIEWQEESFYTTEYFGKLIPCKRLRAINNSKITIFSYFSGLTHK